MQIRATLDAEVPVTNAEAVIITRLALRLDALRTQARALDGKTMPSFRARAVRHTIQQAQRDLDQAIADVKTRNA